jgi:hypothetical protein
MMFSICGAVVVGRLTIALNAGRTPPSKEPLSGVSGSGTRHDPFSSPLGEVVRRWGNSFKNRPLGDVPSPGACYLGGVG